MLAGCAREEMVDCVADCVNETKAGIHFAFSHFASVTCSATIGDLATLLAANRTNQPRNSRISINALEIFPGNRILKMYDLCQVDSTETFRQPQISAE